MKVEEALAALMDLGGHRVDGVRRYLAAQGQKSVCGDAERCAIADFIVARLDPEVRDNFFSISVSPWVMGINRTGTVQVSWYGSDGDDILDDYGDLPRVLNEFANYFDARQFPELLESHQMEV